MGFVFETFQFGGAFVAVELQALLEDLDAAFGEEELLFFQFQLLPFALGRFERWLHGEAVAIGMQMAANVSAELGWLDRNARERVARLLDTARLPHAADDVAVEEVLERMQMDKKIAREGLRLVLLKGIGRAVLAPAPERAVLRAAITRQLS